MDPKEMAQPYSRSTRDYVLNAGAFQVPLHIGACGRGWGGTIDHCIGDVVMYRSALLQLPQLFVISIECGPLITATGPPASGALRADSLDAIPRVPCASLLVRIMTPEMAKIERRKPLPAYSDRAYDTSRDAPTPVERKLYGKYLKVGLIDTFEIVSV